MVLAHDIEATPRTADVRLVENIEFSDMFFPDPVLKGLKDNGFKKPSPIQYKAIPLARCGIDLIVQSKSGTGKTLVFVLSTLEIIDTSINRVQAIVLTPTREIAVQVAGVFSAIGSHMKDLCVRTFIGGLPVAVDATAASKCHVAIGAPGRVKHLVESGKLDTEAVRLFVLDEADQLMGKSFQTDINFIYWKLKENKQMIASSATYTQELVSFLSRYMRMGKLVTPDTDPLPVLRGLTQFAYITDRHADQLARIQLKQAALLDILSKVKFNQCVIFSNYQSRGESAYGRLKEAGWSARWVCGGREQSERQAAVDAWTSGRVRVLVSTDLTARGIDSREADLVINLDPPWDPAIYLHRMGRAARYGTYGIVITILSEGHDVSGFRRMLGQIGGDSLYVLQLPKSLEGIDIWNTGDNLKKIYGIPKKHDDITPESSGALTASDTASAGDKSESSKDFQKPEFVHRDSSFPSLSFSVGCETKPDKPSDTLKKTSETEEKHPSHRKLSYSDMVKDKAECTQSKEDFPALNSETSEKQTYSMMVQNKNEVTRKRSYKECEDEAKEKINPQPKFAEIIKGLQKHENSKTLTKDDLNDFFTQPDISEPISFSDIVKSLNSHMKSTEEKENLSVVKKERRTRQKSQSKEEVFEFRAKPDESEVKEHLHKKAKVLTESVPGNSVQKLLNSPRKEGRGRQRRSSDEKVHKEVRPERHGWKEVSVKDQNGHKEFSVDDYRGNWRVSNVFLNGVGHKQSTSDVSDRKEPKEKDIGRTIGGLHKEILTISKDSIRNKNESISKETEKKTREPNSKSSKQLPSEVLSSATQTVMCQVTSQGIQSDPKESVNKGTQSQISKKLVPKPRVFAQRKSSESDDSSSASEGTYIVSQSYINSSHDVRSDRRRIPNQNPMDYGTWHNMFQNQLWHIQSYVYFSSQ